MTTVKSKNCLVLTQYREDSNYNDFIGKFYHFPESYLNQFKELPLEFVYYEPTKDKGKGVYFGYGKIKKSPFTDKREPGYYFVEIEEYKSFSQPVSFKSINNVIIEQERNPHYNSQNAVRKIPYDLLNELCLDGGIQLNFQADAHLIKVLGEQLIGSEKVGILELIKNAIDANASYCKVRLEKLPDISPIDEENYLFNDYDGPVIVIEDDGVGMNREVIENGWLRPASTFKTNIKEKLKEERLKAEKTGKLGTYNSIVSQLKKEHGGRIPLGEKGVGRFATHRLGRKLQIRTKTKDSPFEFVLSIDWDAFDTHHQSDFLNLDAVNVTLSRQSPSRDYGEEGSGTQIIIYGGREGFIWDKEKIEGINKSVNRLNSPNPNPKKIKSTFFAYLECPQIDELERTEVFEKFTPTFSLDAIVNSDGVVDEWTLNFNPPKSVPLPAEEWSGINYDLKKSSIHWRDQNGKIRKPNCGAFYIHIDAWYRKRPWVDGPDYDEMIKYLDEYGGVSIYRDSIIISPAESGTKNDWLNLAKRHIKQGYRLSYYNMIGNIEIEQSENISLIDKTNREGMIENTAYLDLARLAETIVQNILETKFIDKRDEHTNLTKGIVRDPKTLSSIAKQNSLILRGISENYPLESDPWKILHQLGENVDQRKSGLVKLEDSIKNLKKSIDIIEDVQDRLTEQAGFGIAVAVSLHEIAKITSNFYIGISHILKSGNSDKFRLEDLQEASKSLKSELNRLGPLRTIRNENRREFNISESINYTFEIFKRTLKKEGISFNVNIDEDFQVYARYSALNQILANLFDNSIHWILMSGKRKKEIRVFLSKKFRNLIFADSGSGVDEVIRPYLFQAGYSLKIPPSGLGLYICKSYMQSMNGDIHETVSRERHSSLDGAQFTLEFDTVPKSKEDAK